MTTRMAAISLLLLLPGAFALCPCENDVPMQAGGIQRLSCNYWGVTCNELDVEEIDIGQYSASYAEAQEPSYLDGAQEDCDLYFKGEAIATDLRMKGLVLTMLENRAVNADEEAQDMLEDSNHTLSLIQTVQHQYTFSSTYPSVHVSNPLLGGAYMPGGRGKEMMQAIENTCEAIANAQTAWSYADVSLEELRDAQEGIESFCVEGKCMFPEQKEHYGDLLQTRRDDVSYYTGRMLDFLEDAEGFIEEYNEERAKLNCSGKLRLPLEQPLRIDNGIMHVGNQTAPAGPLRIGGMRVSAQGKGFLLNDSGVAARGNLSLRYANGSFVAGKRKLGVLPARIASEHGEGQMDIVDDDGLRYILRQRKLGRLLGLIPIEMEVEKEISADDGHLISQERPFWGFLVFED